MTKDQLEELIIKEQKELETAIDSIQKEIAYRNGRIAVLKELYKAMVEVVEESKSP